MWHSIVDKDTGVMQEATPNIREGTDRPIHESLAYAPADDFLYKLLVSLDPADHINDAPIDWSQTHYDFTSNSWVIVNGDALPTIDTIAEHNKLRDALLAKANRKLTIPDLPNAVKKALQDYINELQAVEVTEENAPTIFWPELPV